MDFRHFPLADAVEAVDQQASVIVFAERELPGSSDAPVCFCGGDFDDDMLNCVNARQCITSCVLPGMMALVVLPTSIAVVSVMTTQTKMVSVSGTVTSRRSTWMM